jgi:Fic family protein
MMTLKRFAHKLESVPLTTVWYLSELAEARGKQELFTRQSPQKLKVLREHALIESAICSNRIEGVEVEPSRIGAILSGGQLLRDRNEEEVRGYRDALRLIHEKENRLPVSEETLLQLHRLSRGGVGDAGQYKEKPSDIIEKQPDGRVRVRFRTVLPSKTPEFVRQTIDLWEDTLQERKVNPLLLLAAMNLDFLCAMATGGCLGCCSCSSVTISVLKWAGTSASSGSLRKTRSVTTKPWSKARPAGTKANTIPGLTSITFSSS